MTLELSLRSQIGVVENVCICAYKEDYKEYTENANRMLSVGNGIILLVFLFLSFFTIFSVCFLKNNKTLL